MKAVIHLDECPEALKTEVQSYLEHQPKAEILSVQTWTSTPYKDKTIIDTAYTVYTLVGNYFKIFSLRISTKDEYNIPTVRVNGMIAGEIAEIIKLSPEWFQNL
ncbi:hypothetical protein [Paenibacillus amylolyticus]|uniref:hypothetical protein n=1 Tax=Paenibacillus amylolyticus TaxID=1451 RepID=UPI00339AE025